MNRKYIAVIISVVMVFGLLASNVRAENGEIVKPDTIAAVFNYDYSFAVREGSTPGANAKRVKIGEPVYFKVQITQSENSEGKYEGVTAYLHPWAESIGDSEFTDFQFQDTDGEWKDIKEFRKTPYGVLTSSWNLRITFNKAGIYKFFAFAVDSEGKQTLWGGVNTNLPLVAKYLIVEEDNYIYYQSQQDVIDTYGEENVLIRQNEINYYLEREKAEEATTQEVTTEEVTTQQEEPTTQEVTTQKSTEDVTTQEVTTQKSTEDVTTQEVTTQKSTEDVTTQEVTTQKSTEEATTQEVTTQEVTTQQEEPTTQEVTTQKSTEDATTQEVTTQQNTEELTTKEIVTKNETQVVTTKSTSDGDAENYRVVIKSAKKKKGSKKVKISLKKLKSATASGYQIYISKKKSFKKKNILVKKIVNKKKLVKKAKFIIKNTKLKNKKKLWIKVRAYKVVNGKRSYFKWSKNKKIKVN